MSSVSGENDEVLESSTDTTEITSKQDPNSYLQVLYEEMLNFINEPRVAKFAFQFFMIITGLILLKILADRDFPLQDTFLFMILWFVLMLFVPTPKGAKTDVNPFGEEL